MRTTKFNVLYIVAGVLELIAWRCIDGGAYLAFADTHPSLSLVDARSCVTCDKVLAGLEQIDDDTDSFGVDFVKINDKRLAKQYGIKSFPALTYFR